MFVKQISVFLENIKGSLSEMTGILAAGNVDLMALSIADTQNFGILRCVVRSQDCLRAIGLLREQGYTVRETNVLCVGVPDQPGGLNAVLKAIEDHQQNRRCCHRQRHRQGQRFRPLRLQHIRHLRRAKYHKGKLTALP